MPPAILFTCAHPDDESFSGAGTAMKYADAGSGVVLVTATRGERGKRGEPPVCTEDELPACREKELREAAAIIGFHELHLLDYRDRELAGAPVDEMRRTLVPLIRRLRPAVVITFDPNGFNTHPDHVAISRFTSDAIAAAADPRWLPDAGDPHAVARLLWTPPIPPWDAARRTRLDDVAGADFVIDVSRWRDRRAAALRAHRTQHLSTEKYFFNPEAPERVLDFEIWRLGFWVPPGRRPAEDLFEGL